VDINLDINLRGRELYRYRYISISIYPDSTVDIDISYPNTQVCWRLRDSSSQDPYRRILDPRIATALRGRPKNTAQPVPSRMAIGGSSQTVSQLTSLAASQPAGRKRGRPPRIVNKSTLTRVSLEPSQHSNTQANSEVSSISTQCQTRSQSATLGSGRTTGVRASGRRTQPSIRRTRSQWELVDSDENILPSIIVRE
jgi:hypothetical protein